MLFACASLKPTSSSFGFDQRKDQQDAVVLNYRYGNENSSIRPTDWELEKGSGFYFDSIGGIDFQADSLYVKWRDEITKKEYENTVDLRHRLPNNMNDKKVYFMIRGPQLFVYLIESLERRSPTSPPIGPSTYSPYKVTQLYPDQPR